jgi:hypothetical protein
MQKNMMAHTSPPPCPPSPDQLPSYYFVTTAECVVHQILWRPFLENTFLKRAGKYALGGQGKEH